jgi:hypothetical protein
MSPRYPRHRHRLVLNDQRWLSDRGGGGGGAHYDLWTQVAGEYG